MRILALDTCLQSCGVAIVDGGEAVVVKRLDLAKGHAEKLAPQVASALANAGMALKDIDRIGVTIGPGSFTGVRVGLAFARGLAIGTGVPVIGITTLAVLVAELPAQGINAVAIDARRGQVYGQAFAGHTPVTEPLIETPEALAAVFADFAPLDTISWAGTGATLLHPSAQPAGTQPDPLILAQLTAVAPLGPTAPQPLYLRAPDAAPAKPVFS